MTDENSPQFKYRYFIVVGDRIVCFEAYASNNYHHLLWERQKPYIVFFKTFENENWKRAAHGYAEGKVEELMKKGFNPIPDPLIMDKIRSGEV